MYKVNDDVLLTVGEFEVPAKVVLVDKDEMLLLEVYSSKLSGFRYSQLHGIYGDNLAWARPFEVKPYAPIANPIFVYCSHAHGGKPSNVADMTKKLRAMHKEYAQAITQREYVFVSPLNAFPFYDITSYDEGMRQCLSLLSKCDMLVTFGKDWDKSKGVSLEFDYCRNNNISIVSEEDFIKMLEGTK